MSLHDIKFYILKVFWYVFLGTPKIFSLDIAIHLVPLSTYQSEDESITA